MRVVDKTSENKLRFNFTYVNKIFDFLLGIGLKPFIDMTFTPSILASDERTIFWYKGNISLPKNINEWDELITAFVKNCIDRYTLNEVLSWNFEVLNECDVVLGGDAKKYADFFAETYNIFMRIDGRFKVVGPSCMEESITKTNYFENFMDRLIENGIDLKSVSFHVYGEDISEAAQEAFKCQFSEFFFEKMELKLLKFKDKDHLNAVNKKMEQYKKQYGISKVHITEWNYSIIANCTIFDTMFMATFIIYNALKNIGTVTSLGYWNACDIFEENVSVCDPFSGGFGLISRDGVRKPSYHALKFLSQLGNEIVQQGENYIATKSQDGYQILFFNYLYFDKFYMEGDRSLAQKQPYEVFLSGEQQDITIMLSNGADKYRVTEYELSRECGSAYDEWVKTGLPKTLSKADVLYFKNKCMPSVNKWILTENEITVHVKTHGVVFLELTKLNDL